MNTPANPDLIEVIGDFKALRTLLRKNMTGVMLMSMLQGKEPDEVGVEIPLTVVMGMESVIGTLLDIVKQMELVDEVAVKAYMDGEMAKAAKMADTESIEKESKMEATSDAADECDCPACTLRRKLGGDEDASSGIAEALAGTFGGDGEFEVREIKGQLAKQLVEVLLRGRGKAETNEEDVPPMAHRH